MLTVPYFAAYSNSAGPVSARYMQEVNLTSLPTSCSTVPVRFLRGKEKFALACERDHTDVVMDVRICVAYAFPAKCLTCHQECHGRTTAQILTMAERRVQELEMMVFRISHISSHCLTEAVASLRTPEMVWRTCTSGSGLRLSINL
jgi:hypothetical protein